MANILKDRHFRNKATMAHYNLIETLNIYPEMNWFLDNVFHKRHVKSENLEKPKATNTRFKQHVFGKPKVSLARI